MKELQPKKEEKIEKDLQPKKEEKIEIEKPKPIKGYAKNTKIKKHSFPTEAILPKKFVVPTIKNPFEIDGDESGSD